MPLAVEAFAGASVVGVDSVVDDTAVFEGDLSEVALGVVVVGGSAIGGGFLAQIACWVVVVGSAAPVEELVLAVVVGDQDAVFVGAVAVGVIVPGSGGCARSDDAESALWVVGVAFVGLGVSKQYFLGVGDATQGIVGVRVLQGCGPLRILGKPGGERGADLIQECLRGGVDVAGVEGTGRGCRYIRCVDVLAGPASKTGGKIAHSRLDAGWGEIGVDVGNQCFGAGVKLQEAGIGTTPFGRTRWPGEVVFIRQVGTGDGYALWDTGEAFGCRLCSSFGKWPSDRDDLAQPLCGRAQDDAVGPLRDMGGEAITQGQHERANDGSIIRQFWAEIDALHVGGCA